MPTHGSHAEEEVADDGEDRWRSRPCHRLGRGRRSVCAYLESSHTDLCTVGEFAAGLAMAASMASRRGVGMDLAGGAAGRSVKEGAILRDEADLS